MKAARKTICALVMVTLLCAMMATAVVAAESGNLWLNNAADEATGRTTVLVCADTSVANGLIELRYDSSKLTYDSISVGQEYVGAFAVNADTEGLVKIAWVAPGAYETDGDGIALITVNFQGVAVDTDISVTGNVYDGVGDLLTIINTLNTEALEAAIANAKALNKSDYTEKSFAAVETALAEAETVLADKGASQSQVDAATEKLNNALNALVKAPADDGGNADTGDTILPAVTMLVLSLVAMTICLGKKGWCAK